MRMRKGQTAMEYLMTYGWAILIIMVVLAVLFYLGVLNPQIPSQCIFPAGISCSTYKISADTGKLTLQIGQGTGKTIRVTGVSCTQNSSASYTTSAFISYSNIGGTASTNVTIPSGSTGFIADPVNGAAGVSNVTCTDTNNLALGTTTIGTQYNGKIYINYTEVETEVTRVAAGTFTTYFES